MSSNILKFKQPVQMAASMKGKEFKLKLSRNSEERILIFSKKNKQNSFWLKFIENNFFLLD